MNKTILNVVLLSILICCINKDTTAQSPYSYYLDSTCVWYELYQGSQEYSFKTHFINGDTTIYGKTYFKQYYHQKDSDWSSGSYEVTIDLNKFRKVIREDSLKRFYSIYLYGISTETLDHDFNQNLLDTFVSQSICDIEQIDTLYIGATPLKYFNPLTIVNATGLKRGEVEGIGRVGPYCATGIDSNEGICFFEKQNELLDLCNNYELYNWLPRNPLFLDAYTQNANCIDSNDGSVQFLNPNGLEYSYIEIYDNVILITDWNALDNRTYSYIVYDDYDNVIYNNYFTIAVNPMFTIYSSHVDIVDAINTNNGSIQINQINSSSGAMLSDYDILWSNGMIGDSITNLTSGSYTATITDMFGCIKEYTYEVDLIGCTDQTACNYNVNSTVDDGNCLPAITLDYVVNIDTPNIEFSIDFAINGGENNNYQVSGILSGIAMAGALSSIGPYNCTDTATIFISDLSCNQSFDIPINCVGGCTDINACNYNSNANINDGSCLPMPICNTDICLGNVEIVDSCACITSIVQVLGCIDSIANNYNAIANCDDGSCDFSVGILESNLQNSFTIQPNHVNDYCIITWSNEINKVNSISIYDLQGGLIRKVDLQNNGTNQTELKNLSELTSGVYLISLETEVGLLTEKMVKY